MAARIAKHPTDRRSARTRAMLQHALLSLIRVKGYEAITIKDICDAANVGRSTFYAHFTGKDDLKRSGFEHLRRTLAELQRHALSAPRQAGDGSFAFALALFRHAREHVDLHRALGGGRGGAVAMESIRQILTDLVHEELAPPGGKNSAERDMAVQYVVGACMAVLTWWLDNGAKLPPEHIDATFRRLVAEGVKPSLLA